MTAVDALVGRSEELSIGESLVGGLVRGRSAVLLIEGEAGIGKTRLLRHILADAESRGCAVHVGAAHPFDTARPFAMVTDALGLHRRSEDPTRASIGRLLSGDDALRASEDVRPTVIEATVELVESMCVSGPVVLGFEDVHWADDSSLAALGALVDQLAAMPLLVLATLRPTPRRAPLDLLVDEFLDAGAQRLRLGAFSASQVDELVTAALGGVAGPVLSSMIERAGGNALWLVELLRSLQAEGWLRRDGDVVEAASDELPSTFRDLVLRRLRYLPAQTLTALQLAAVLGDAVSVRNLAVVAQRESLDLLADLAEAFRARLLDEANESVVFRHQLVQQVIYEDIPAPTRIALHRAAAARLEDAATDPMTVASHLLLGAQPGDVDAVRGLRRAATAALTGSPQVASELLNRARELLPSGHSDADSVRADLAIALMRAGDVAQAADLATEVLDGSRGVSGAVELLLVLVDALPLLGRADEVVRVADRALASAALSDAEQARVLAQASYGQTFSGNLAAAEATAGRALDAAERAHDVAAQVWSLGALAVAVKTQGRYDEALASVQHAVALNDAAPRDDAAHRRHPDFFLGMVLADSDDFAAAKDAYARALRDSDELGSQWLAPEMVMLVGETKFLVGEWDDAAADLEAGIKLSRRYGQQISVAQSRGYLSLMATARGDAALAESVLGDSVAQLHVDDPVYGTEVVALADATRRECGGDQAGALDVLARFWRIDADRGVRYYHRALAPALVRLACAAGSADLVAEVVRGMDEAAALAGGIATVTGAAARCRGLRDQDPDLLLRAVGLARDGGRILDHAGACEEAAAALVTCGRSDEAVAVLDEALAGYNAVSATAYVGRVSAALRALGRRTGARGARQRPERGWQSLTPSERTVCDLVADGLTNRQVAQRLHVSPHTVNTHLRHVFQKLSVTTRTELAGLVLRERNNHASE